MQAKQTERGTLVTFGDVLFDYDRAELKPGGMRSVQKLADFLNDNPERKVIVEGYTDSTGSAEYNQRLSERRADAVRMALVKMGVDPQRIVSQGYGKEYPVASNSDSAGRAMNRRVEVTISDDNKPVAPARRCADQPARTLPTQRCVGSVFLCPRPRAEPSAQRSSPPGTGSSMQRTARFLLSTRTPVSPFCSVSNSTSTPSMHCATCDAGCNDTR